MQDEQANAPKPGDEIKPWQPPSKDTTEKTETPAPAAPTPQPEPTLTELEAQQAAKSNKSQPEPSRPPEPATQTPLADPTPEAPSVSDEPEGGWAFTGGEAATESTADFDAIEWSASEYIAHEKSPAWFAGVASGAAVVAAVIFFITSEVLAAITILVVAFVGMFYSARRPETRQYKLTSGGLVVDGKRYAMSEFRSFSVVQEGAIESIWLETLNKFTPTLRLYFAPEDGAAITEALSQVLPYNQRELDAVERASRRIRF